MVLGAPPTSFIGRVSELELVGQLLEQTRLLTITGTAGSGKTRLAYEAVHQLRSRYPGGIFICELAPLANAERLAAALGAAFDIGADPGDRLVEVVAQQVGERNALLLLDNCEHLRPAVADLIVRLLAATSALSILATSRERLRVAGEAAWPIPPMSLPDESGGLEGSDAAQLFLERVRAMAPTYTLSSDASVAVAQICTRLEGLPLAIELAAGRLVLVTPAQVMTMLDDALGLLAGGVGVSRHRTLRVALDWSYDLLAEEDRSTFHRLSAFAGTFSLSAVAAVLEMDQTATLDRLAALRDGSLLVADTRGETATFRLLEPVRQYAADRLRRAGDDGVVRRLHASWVLASIEAVCARILGHGQLAAVRTFRELLPDFRRGFSWSLTEEPAWAARMAAATEMAWEIVGQLAEGDIILRAALEARPTDSELARIYFGLANLGLHHGDPRTLEFAERAVGCARAAAATGIELGHALCVLGFASVGVGEPDISNAAFDEAAEVADRIGDRLLRVWIDSGRTRAVALAGKLDEARSAWEAQIPVLVELGDIHHVGMRFSNIAYLCQLQGDNVGARGALRANLRLLADYRNWAVSTNDVAVAAVLAARAGRAREAARLAGAYWRLCKLFDVKPGTLVPQLDVKPGALVPELDLIRTRLTPADYGAAVAEGASLPIAEMYELARQEAERSDPMDHGQLTGRELQVAKLVARGLSDKEVAARLSRSERTVESHVQHALRKLNMSSRTELGAWAQKHGLLD
jgi:predicted ATPase/DNA-binding CsgD family transcriptional regulator